VFRINSHLDQFKLALWYDKVDVLLLLANAATATNEGRNIHEFIMNVKP
jgi:hypothetical protein